MSGNTSWRWQWLIVQASYLYCTFHNHHITFGSTLSNTIMPGIVGQDQEFWTNGIGKQHSEKQYVHPNYTLLIWALLGPEEMKQYLQKNNTYKNDEQSFQCTCILYKKYPITVKYSNILHHNRLWSSDYIPYQTITKSTESTGNIERLFTSLHKLCLLQNNVGETQNSVATFIGSCSCPMPIHYVKNQMGYVENPLKFLHKLKIYMLFIQQYKWVWKTVKNSAVKLGILCTTLCSTYFVSLICNNNKLVKC